MTTDLRGVGQAFEKLGHQMGLASGALANFGTSLGQAVDQELERRRAQREVRPRGLSLRQIAAQRGESASS